MKQYQLVELNKGVSFTIDSDAKKAEETINEMVAEGWILQQIVTPNNPGAAMIGVFYKEA